MRSASSQASFQRILLSGGGGFVGGTLAPLVAQAFPRSERFLIRRRGSKEEREDWHTVEADICNESDVTDIVDRVKPDLVIHLAAQSSVAASANVAEATWRVNFGGSLALASACARITPRATFFFVSSAEVYGLSFRDGAVSENTPLAPTSVYGRTKAAAEQMLADVLPTSARLIVARSFNHTGMGQDERFVLSSFAAQIARIEAGRQPAEIRVGNIDVERDFLDVRDVCNAYLGLIEASPDLAARDTFNISSGTTYSIRSLLDLLGLQSSAVFSVTTDPSRLRLSDIQRTVGSNQKIKDSIGWSPIYPIEATLASLLGYWREATRKEQGAPPM